jgi:hypothetical protein
MTLFTDDCALNAESQPAMQESMDNFSIECDNFGLTISIRKTGDGTTSSGKTVF